MKKILVICFFLPLFSTPCFCIDYFKGDFNAILDSARKSDKLIFLNIAAAWSNASNRMEMSVLKADNIDKLISRAFLSLRVEASSKEGLQLQQRYGLAILPAYLILNSSGNIIRLRVGESKSDSFLTFLKEAIVDPAGYHTLEKQTIQVFNQSAKLPSDYAWTSYNLNYLLAKAEVALVLFTANEYKPKGVVAKTEVFNVLVSCARKAGKVHNIALLNEVGIYAEKIGFKGREMILLNLLYAIESSNSKEVNQYLAELSNYKDRYSDFQFTGVVLSEFMRIVAEIHNRFANPEQLLATLDAVSIQNTTFERVYPERVYKFHRAYLLEKLGHYEEAKKIAHAILPTYEFVSAHSDYDEAVVELEKIVDERE